MRIPIESTLWMPLHSLLTCDWGDRCRKDDLTESPTWDLIESAIRRLDNDRFNDVYLQRDAESEEFWLSVGGGAGRYLVTGSSPEGFPTVVDRSRASERDELLCVGGQTGYFPARWIQPLEVALVAARYFFETGSFGGPVEWEMARKTG